MAATNHGQFYFKLYVALIKEKTQTEQNERTTTRTRTLSQHTRRHTCHSDKQGLRIIIIITVTLFHCCTM